MLYSLLQFKQNGNKFEYSEDRFDDTDRQYRKPYIKGFLGRAFVYCPRGKEKEWKKKLKYYLRKSLLDQIKMNNLLLKNLNSYL